MNEKVPPLDKFEIFPGEFEVLEVMHEYIRDRGAKEVVKNEDEHGLLRLDYEVIVDGEKTVYSYKRDSNGHTAIDQVFYDETGIPCGGRPLMLYLEGQWKWA
jgi:hypothetical protein